VFSSAFSHRYFMFAAENGVVHVLVVEDTAKLAQLLARGLCEEGWQVDVVGHGEEALRMVRATAYDLIVLDGMLSDLDGVAVCGRLRDSGVRTPLLMLSARDAVADRIAALSGEAVRVRGTARPAACAQSTHAAAAAGRRLMGRNVAAGGPGRGWCHREISAASRPVRAHANLRWEAAVTGAKGRAWLSPKPRTQPQQAPEQWALAARLQEGIE